jgi:hypothetical protein
MPSFSWYRKRLMSMTAVEVLWRFRSAVRDQLDRYRRLPGSFAQGPGLPPGFEAAGGAGFHLPDTSRLADGMMRPAWRRNLIERADRIAAHRLSLFDRRRIFVGSPIEWNRDHAHGIASPLSHSPSIDYRDFRVTGDCKLVWELNRHLHLTVLGRAYSVTGDQRYAAEAVDQIRSWMDQCPFGRGMNWRSPLELGIRLINWVWAAGLIRDSGLLRGGFLERLLNVVYQHLSEITRRYSRGTSANNHLIGESAGVFVASAYFDRLPKASQWRDESQKRLEEEIVAQTFDDGCTREQAMGYHLFVLQFFIICGLVGRWTGREFSSAYWRRIETMLEFAGALLEGGGKLPMFGDADDGYVLDLGQGGFSVRDLLCLGAVLFNRSDFKALSGGFREPVLWLLGRSGLDGFQAVPESSGGRRLRSRSFPESGYYLLQSGSAEKPDRISVIMDCGPLGFKSIAAHGHADALSIVLRAFGRDVLVDPGTYDYFSHPDWRTYFRSTKAHNTVVIDDRDQSEMLGPFMWGRPAESKCLLWDPWPDGGGRLLAEHDGYCRGNNAVFHRRRIELNPKARSVTITDEFLAGAHHRIVLFFHIAENCEASINRLGTVVVSLPGGKLLMRLDSRLKPALFIGSEDPEAGWVSRRYHRKVPAHCLRAEGEISGGDVFRTIIRIGVPDMGAHAREQAFQTYR